MSRVARLLEVLIKLQTKPRFSVQELAEEFAVSRRTMLRDLHTLSEIGVPLAASPGPSGGYSLISRRRFLPISLTVDEAIALLLSYEAFLQYAQSPFAAQSLSAITKMRGAIPPETVQELDRVHRHVAIVEPARTYEAPFLAELLQAAVDGVHLEVQYESRFGLSQRLIYPIGLVAEHGFWYCACHDYRRADVLTLRADRFRSVERVEGREPPPTTSLREWLETRWSDAGETLHLRARVNRRAATSFDLESIVGPMPIDEQGDGVIDREIPASEIDFYAARLLAVGTDLVIESPIQLVDAMQRKARQIVDLYGEAVD